MVVPEFDADGYPTDRTLDAIQHWHIQSLEHCADLLSFCIEAWKYDVTHEAWFYEFNTGGWSGNEDIMAAMQKNWLFWALAWISSERGGRYRFTLNFPQPKEKDL